MKNQAYRMSMLYDFYGDLLTERQKEFYDLYYNEDLSLSEIAENYGISRQGVRDVIVRAEAYLEELEEKTGLIARFHAMQDQLKELSGLIEKVEQFNMENYANRELDMLVRDMKALTAKLIEE